MVLKRFFFSFSKLNFYFSQFPDYRNRIFTASLFLSCAKRCEDRAIKGRSKEERGEREGRNNFQQLFPIDEIKGEKTFLRRRRSRMVAALRRSTVTVFFLQALQAQRRQRRPPPAAWPSAPSPAARCCWWPPPAPQPSGASTWPPAAASAPSDAAAAVASGVEPFDSPSSESSESDRPLP